MGDKGQGSPEGGIFFWSSCFAEYHLKVAAGCFQAACLEINGIDNVILQLLLVLNLNVSHKVITALLLSVVLDDADVIALLVATEGDQGFPCRDQAMKYPMRHF